MLTIYGSDLSGPCNKTRFVANYLGLNYEYRRINLREGEQKQAWFLKINPVGKVPAMEEDGFCLFESAAICKYFCDQKGSDVLTAGQKSESRPNEVSVGTFFYPKDLKQRAIVEQWTDFINLHISANLVKVVYNRLFAPMRNMPVNQESVEEGLKFLSQYFPAIEEQLTKHKFIVSNELTLADMTLLAALDPAEMAQVSLSPYPKLTAWRQGLKSQTFYTKCHKEYGESLKQAAGR